VRLPREAGLIEPLWRANFIHYRPVAGALERWQRALTECCCTPEERVECCPPERRDESPESQDDE